MKLYSTLTRDKRDFEPAGDAVTMYVCGITASNSSHVGHALSSVVFDVLHRYLEYRGYAVRRVQNFTDVDDKIIARANAEGLSPEEVAEKYVQEFFRDMDDLNVRRATEHPRATNEIPGIIRMIEGLIEKGNAYPAADESGNVYFRVHSNPEYGKLSGRTVEELLEGVRIDVEPGKEAPPDFALWKASKPGEPSWDSPWGPGRPGWHIECSAMALEYLGETIDIHGGGLDLAFPHHENELAQSECFTGQKPFARFWVHNGLLRLDGAKMSKSLGNLVTVRDALDGYSADAIRMYILTSHYRGPLLYDEDNIGTQERASRRLRQAANVASRADSGKSVDPAPFREHFVEVMDDDLNTPQGLAVIFDLAHEINRGRDAGHEIGAAQAVLRELSDVLGLTLAEPEASEAGLSDADVEARLVSRTEARSNREFAAADAIRDELIAAGIAIEDGPGGTTWSRV
ncbi:MAG: cysteine--tRNA ligase [Chloroflexi bacterium]|nr:cysteine--tRNA ligase [Chloroflexota bacterium]